MSAGMFFPSSSPEHRDQFRKQALSRVRSAVLEQYTSDLYSYIANEQETEVFHEANSGQVSLQSRNGERQSCPGGNTANQGEENHLAS